MRKDLEVGKVYKTFNLNKFKKLETNRDITDRRKEKVKKSVNENGYVFNPIIVNEYMEVIDGQGRLEACRELGFPIYYVIGDGLGREECVILNANNTNWSTIDYIKSYAVDIPDYKRLLCLCEKYKMFTFKTVSAAANNLCEPDSKRIKNGSWILTEDDYVTGMNVLEYLKKFSPYVDHIKGKKICMYRTLMFCFGHADVDNNTLVENFKKYYSMIEPPVNQKLANEQVERLYNYNAKRRERVYIATDYERYLEGRYSWYARKYGSRSNQ